MITNYITMVANNAMAWLLRLPLTRWLYHAIMCHGNYIFLTQSGHDVDFEHLPGTDRIGIFDTGPDRAP